VARAHLAIAFEYGVKERKTMQRWDQRCNTGWGGSMTGGIEDGTSAHGGRRGGRVKKWGTDVDFVVRCKEHKAQEGGRRVRRAPAPCIR